MEKVVLPIVVPNVEDQPRFDWCGCKMVETAEGRMARCEAMSRGLKFSED